LSSGFCASVDALGLLCPLPILRLEQALGRVQPGDVIEVLADDEEIQRDLPAFCDGNGHELIELEQLGERARPTWRALVRRGGVKPTRD
jgi:tRNA 2-thiouridine synthesizing protein A